MRAAHDALLCIGTGSTLVDPNRLRFEEHEFYYKSPEEMHALFKHCPQAARETLKIAERCNVEIKLDQMLLPHYEVPAGQTADGFLEKLCLEGMQRRYGAEQVRYMERLKYELSVIRKMGFSTYFLIVWDFVHWAKNNGVPVGPGRGSGAGSIVSYVLAITDICPMKYGLLFERFLNPDRRSMPDLGHRFFRRRARARHPVCAQQVRRKKRGPDHHLRIDAGAPGRQRRRPRHGLSAFRGGPHRQADSARARAPPSTWRARTFRNSSRSARQNPEVEKLLQVAQRLEGLKRHTGVHAAGIVIAKGDLTQYVPLAKGAKDVITTQYNDEALLKLGLLKMDFLGLRTLTVIDHACKLVRERHKPDFDIRTHPAGRSGHLQASSGRQSDRSVPAGKHRHARSSAQAPSLRFRGNHRAHRPLPAGPHGRRDARGVREAQAQPVDDQIRPPGPGARAEGNLRRHSLSGAGHAHLARFRRLHARDKRTSCARPWGKRFRKKSKSCAACSWKGPKPKASKKKPPIRSLSRS